MKKSVLFLVLVGLLTLARLAHGAPGEIISEQIAKLKLAGGALPEGLAITQEVWATSEQLGKARLRMGFPVLSLLNQILSSPDGQAQVNYLSVPDESWLALGYSNLIEADGKKSLIFVKNSAIIQIAAATTDLETQIARLLGIDPIYFTKLSMRDVPSTFELIREKVYLSNDLGQFSHEVGLPVEAALSQELNAGHTNMMIRYFRCGDPLASVDLVRKMAEGKKPLRKMLIGLCGKLVVVIESQNEDVNERVMSLVRFPDDCKLQMFPITWQ